jgi:antitoxin component HigA of HigAB toxin-antitoxin module
MTVKAITNDAEYKAALAEIHRLWDCPAGSEDEQKFIALGEAVVIWEQKQFPIPKPDDSYDGEPD